VQLPATEQQPQSALVSLLASSDGEDLAATGAGVTSQLCMTTFTVNPLSLLTVRGISVMPVTDSNQVFFVNSLYIIF